MNKYVSALLRIAAFGLMLICWRWWMLPPFAPALDPSIIAGLTLLIFPLVGLGRTILDRLPTPDRTVRITTIVHCAVIFLLGACVFRGMATYAQWPDRELPVPLPP
jgi:hypothetical protein